MHTGISLTDQFTPCTFLNSQAVAVNERFEALEFDVNELEAKLSEARATLQSEKARGMELQLTLGAQALQLSQVWVCLCGLDPGQTPDGF